MIIFPENNLPDQSQDWADTVEREIKRIDKKTVSITNVSQGNPVPGPQGPQGPAGPEGPEGPQGLQGEPGVDGQDGQIGPQGPQGEPGRDGVDGVDGQDGRDGLDGAEGPQGPRGETGPQGPAGPEGPQGETGPQGPRGVAGSPGAEGKSAYEIAKENGFEGTEEEWLLSLIGLNGAPGADGKTGPIGPAGPQGLTGLSAYQVAQLNGFTGTEQEWLDSLQGDTGLPTGGTPGQVLTKTSTTDYAVEWADPASAIAYTSTVKHSVKAGVPLTKGQAVYISSSDGTNMIASKASNASEATSSKTMGLIAQDLAHNAFGFVVTEGLLAGLDTSLANSGDTVWLGVDGNLLFGLANKPSAPAHLVFIGIVTRANANNGEIFVKVQNGFELKEIHDVSISNPQHNDVLAYDSATGLWKATKTPLRYVHTQTMALSTWLINHYMGYMPSITIIDSGGNEVEGTIVYNSTDTLTLSFSAEMSGTAYLS